MSLAQEKAAGAAILEAYMPGQFGARAVAKVLLGLASPAGRLPYTVYKASWVNETSMLEMDPRVAPGKPLAPFVPGSWGNTMRDAVRNKERWKGRRAPTQDPSTDRQR